jgi:predicted subunit of tRNA(5-methylaminomethyl-2-thiouridylate) methyltransferase
MKNGIFTLDWGSVADAAVTAVVLAVLGGLVTLVATAHGFNVFTADWKMIGENMVNVGFAAAVVSLSQNVMSTNKGSVLGVTPEYPTQG